LERNAMGYVENIMGDNERTVYQTHQHAIVLLERIILWLLALLVFLGLGLTLLLSGDDQAGEKIRWYIGLVLLISLLIPVYLIASAWISGLRGRDLLKHVWRSVAAGVVILAVALFIMIRPEFRFTGWIGVAVAVIPFFELARIFLDWLNERYIITNRRVMEVRGIINKHVRDSALEKVNDVDLNQSVIGRLLGYGTVQIITGSDIGVNKFHRISNPARFKRAMLNAKEQLHVNAEYRPEESTHPRPSPDDAGDTAREPVPVSGDDIPEMIAELAELHEKGAISEEEFRAKKTELLDRL
jgi:hypothetical protein